jgi:hypothetical protein
MVCPRVRSAECLELHCWATGAAILSLCRYGPAKNNLHTKKVSGISYETIFDLHYHCESLFYALSNNLLPMPAGWICSHRELCST